jgi:hypothetical protein
MMKDDFKDDPDFSDFETPTFEPYVDEEVYASRMLDIDDVDDVDTSDQYIGAQVRVPIGDEIQSGKVVRCNRELDGNAKGQANANSMLNTRIYEIEFPDGRNDEYTANFIAENMYEQRDEEGTTSTWWNVLLTTRLIVMMWNARICTSNMEVTSKSVRQPRVGTCALNGNTGQHVGNVWQISRR